MDRKNIFDGVVKVFDFEKDALRYMDAHSKENWRVYEEVGYVSSGGYRLWKNDKENCIANRVGDNFYTLYKSYGAFEAVEAYLAKHAGDLSDYIGFDHLFLDNKDRIVNAFLLAHGMKLPPAYSQEEFCTLAQVCLVDSFEVDEHLSGATAYCGEYIINASSDFRWKLERKSFGHRDEYVPCIVSDELGTFDIAHELLNAIDKRYSDEFLWAGLPYDVQNWFKKKTGRYLVEQVQN